MQYTVPITFASSMLLVMSMLLIRCVSFFFLEHEKISIRQMRHRVHVEDMVSELVDGVPYFAIYFFLVCQAEMCLIPVRVQRAAGAEL